MTTGTSARVERWTAASRGALVVVAVLAVLALLAPLALGPGSMDRLTVLYLYVILAAMWNALAGYAGLVSIGQQLFLGLGAYFTIKLADWGMNPFLAMVVGAVIVGEAAEGVSVGVTPAGTSTRKKPTLPPPPPAVLPI